MRCEHCGTLMEGSNGTCPLCGATCRVQTPIHPPRAHKLRRYLVPFSQAYIITCVIVGIFLIVYNALFMKGHHYWMVPCMSMTYVYFTIRYTVLGPDNSFAKLLSQNIAVLILLGVIAWVFDIKAIHEWAIPFAYGTIALATLVVAIVRSKTATKFLLSIVVHGLLAVALLLNVIIRGLNWVPACVCAAVGMTVSIVIICLRPQEVKQQLIRTLKT